MRMYYDNKRLALSIFWIVLGAALLILTNTDVIPEMYSGMGAVLVVIGMLQVIRNLKYRKDSVYREKIDTEAQDERNRFLRMKSWSWTGYIVVMAQSIGVIIAMVLGQDQIQHVLSYSVCLMLCTYWISYVVLSRKY